jgi:hypothetical protein
MIDSAFREDEDGLLFLNRMMLQFSGHRYGKVVWLMECHSMPMLLYGDGRTKMQEALLGNLGEPGIHGRCLRHCGGRTNIHEQHAMIVWWINMEA